MNFGGFENCLHRTNQEHRSEAQEILLEDTFQGREDKQTQYELILILILIFDLLIKVALESTYSRRYKWMHHRQCFN